MPILHKTIDLRKQGPLQGAGTSHNQKLQSALNKYGKEGWAFQNIIDGMSVVFTKEVTEAEFDKAQKEEEASFETPKAIKEPATITPSETEKNTDDDTGSPNEEEDEIEVDLSRMTKAQLVEFAVENEILVDANATNAVIMETIENALTN